MKTREVYFFTITLDNLGRPKRAVFVFKLFLSNVL
jgi:hypothetical protein